MDPSDSRPGHLPVIYSHQALSPAAPAAGDTRSGLPGSVVDLSTPAALSHPGEPLRCVRSLLRGECWLRHLWQGGHSQMCNEAVSGSLTLRLTSSFVAGSAVEIALDDAAGTTCVSSNSHGELLSVHKINPALPGAPEGTKAM